MYNQPNSPLLTNQPVTVQPAMGYMPQQGPTIIAVGGGGGGTLCPFCNQTTASVSRKKLGCVSWAWICALFWSTAGILSLIPCCVDSCKDIEQVCANCSNVKTVIPANCC